MNDFTKIAGIPSGGGHASQPKPERTEAKKPEPAPAQQNWWDFYAPPQNFTPPPVIEWTQYVYEHIPNCGDLRNIKTGQIHPETAYALLPAWAQESITSQTKPWPAAVPMTDYFKEQQEISLQWPEIYRYDEKN